MWSGNYDNIPFSLNPSGVFFSLPFLFSYSTVGFLSRVGSVSKFLPHLNPHKIGFVRGGQEIDEIPERDFIVRSSILGLILKKNKKII